MTTSNTVRERFIDAALCGGTYVGPPVVYVGLLVKGKAGAVREVEDASYARRPVKFAQSLPGGETWNVDAVEFALAESLLLGDDGTSRWYVTAQDTRNDKEPT